MTMTWEEDIAAWATPYYEFRWVGLIGLSLWFVFHFVAGFVLETQTNWIKKNAEGLKQSDEKKGKKVKDDKYYYTRAKWEMSIKATALFHAIGSSLGSIFAIVTSDTLFMTPETLYETDALKKAIITFSACYFLYDLALAIIDKDPMFFVHGFSSSIIYCHAAARDYCLTLGLFFLMYEISSIPLNIRALCIASQNTKNAFFPIVEKTFFFSFIIARCMIGMTYSVLFTLPVLWTALTDPKHVPHSYIATFIFMFSNCALNTLNLIWLKSMIDIAMGKGKHNAKTTPSKYADQKKD